MSHERDLPRYAEAAPEKFLSLLETDLKKPEPVVLGLLKPASTGIFGSCPRTGLLWALECLAWKPQNLPRVIAILAQLSRTKINDNWANKPIGSLEAIFRSWMPQTAASLEERCKALDFWQALSRYRLGDLHRAVQSRLARWRLQLPAALAQRCVRRGSASPDAKGNLRVCAQGVGPRARLA